MFNQIMARHKRYVLVVFHQMATLHEQIYQQSVASFEQLCEQFRVNSQVSERAREQASERLCGQLGFRAGL